MGEKLEERIDSENSLKQFVYLNLHKVRNCHEYYDEFVECNRIKGRFHQYFIFGEFLDCSNWKSDYKNCEKALLDVDKNLEKLASIIRHEDERKEQRLRDHLQNDVWPRRTQPPANWNTELPEWLEKRREQENLRSVRHCVIS